MSRRPTSLLLLLLPLAVLAACAGEEAPAAPPQAHAALVRAAAPDVEDVTDLAHLAADLEPLRRAVLAAEVPGTVESLSCEEGQAVAAGALLATVDTRALEQAVAEAEAVHRQAEAQHQRAQALLERHAITKQALLDAVTNLDVAEARLATARLNLAKSKLQAPWAGRIAVKRVEVGDYVLPGTPVVELVDASRLEVSAAAPASDVPYLRVGIPVTVTVDSLPGQSFTGRVVRLGAELDRAARTLDVRAEIDNPGGRLRPGMLARMEVPLRTLERAILVPLDAVVDLGGRRVVYVVEDGKAVQRDIEQGPVLGRRVVVDRGLAPSDRVIVDGAQLVGPGQPVKLAEGS